MIDSTITLRPVKKEDEDFLWEILYQAIYVGPNEEAPPPSILEEPEISRYLIDWGRDYDQGWIAEVADSGETLGAAWLRLWKDESESGYGFYALDYPELTIALLPKARGQGIGTALMKRLIENARKIHPGVSLSVANESPARRLYGRLGFKTVSEDENSIIMVLIF